MSVSIQVINGAIHKIVAGQNSGHTGPGPVAIDRPPGGLALCPQYFTVQAFNATGAGTAVAGAPAVVKRESKRDDEFQRSAESLNRESKFADETEILNTAQWQEVLNAIKHQHEEVALKLVNIYASFLAKESNHSFLITLLSKAIKTNSAILLKKIFSLAPLKVLEKSFTFQHMMLPMGYALHHQANRAVIQTLQSAGASMHASYASGPDLTAQVITRLSAGENASQYSVSQKSYSATASKNSVGLGNGFTPAFDASALWSSHASDLGDIEQSAASAGSPGPGATMSYGTGAGAGRTSAQSDLSDFYVSDLSEGDNNGEYFAYDPSPSHFDGSLQGVRPSEMVLASAGPCDVDADGFEPFGSGFSFSRGMGFESFR